MTNELITELAKLFRDYGVPARGRGRRFSDPVKSRIFVADLGRCQHQRPQSGNRNFRDDSWLLKGVVEVETLSKDCCRRSCTLEE